jgi:hypothetical protein
VVLTQALTQNPQDPTRNLDMLCQEVQERRLLHTEQMRVFQGSDGGGAGFRIERGEFAEHLPFPQKAQLFHPIVHAHFPRDNNVCGHAHIALVHNFLTGPDGNLVKDGRDVNQ